MAKMGFHREMQRWKMENERAATGELEDEGNSMRVK